MEANQLYFSFTKENSDVDLENRDVDLENSDVDLENSDVDLDTNTSNTIKGTVLQMTQTIHKLAFALKCYSL